MRKMRLRKVKYVAKGHTASKWQSWNSHGSISDSKFYTIFTLLYYLSTYVVRILLQGGKIRCFSTRYGNTFNLLRTPHQGALISC